MAISDRDLECETVTLVFVMHKIHINTSVEIRGKGCKRILATFQEHAERLTASTRDAIQAFMYKSLLSSVTLAVRPHERRGATVP